MTDRQSYYRVICRDYTSQPRAARVDAERLKELMDAMCDQEHQIVEVPSC